MASVLYVFELNIKLFELEVCEIHAHVHLFIVNMDISNEKVREIVIMSK